MLDVPPVVYDLSALLWVRLMGVGDKLVERSQQTVNFIACLFIGFGLVLEGQVHLNLWNLLTNDNGILSHITHHRSVEA